MKIRREHDTIWISGTLADNRAHRHHALQVTWAGPNGRISLSTADDLLEGACVIVDGGTEHALEMRDGLIALIDSESAAATAIRDRFLAGAPSASVDWDWDGRELPELPGGDSSTDLDARIETVLGWLDDSEERNAWAEVDLAGALAQVHLSDSRFLHLFSEQVGTPWRTYLVWRRALVAMTRVFDGATLTEAAHEAGYSDSAHLSRQFVSLFGVTPAAFARRATVIGD